MTDRYAKFSLILKIKREASKTLGVEVGQRPTFLGEWGIQVYSFSVRRYFGRKVSRSTWLFISSWTQPVSSNFHGFTPAIISNTNLSSHKIYSVGWRWWQASFFWPTTSTFWPTFCAPKDRSFNVCASLPFELQFEVLGLVFYIIPETAGTQPVRVLFLVDGCWVKWIVSFLF